MSIHLSQVFDYLDSHPVSKYEGDFASLLEMIHYIYTTCNPIDSEKLRDGFRQLKAILPPLSFDDETAACNLVCDLCYEHEQTAFYHGLLAGMHLMTEINRLP